MSMLEAVHFATASATLDEFASSEQAVAIVHAGEANAVDAGDSLKGLIETLLSTGLEHFSGGEGPAMGRSHRPAPRRRLWFPRTVPRP